MGWNACETAHGVDGLERKHAKGWNARSTSRGSASRRIQNRDGDQP
jgi:hypothetical protein